MFYRLITENLKDYTGSGFIISNFDLLRFVKDSQFHHNICFECNVTILEVVSNSDDNFKDANANLGRWWCGAREAHFCFLQWKSQKNKMTSSFRAIDKVENNYS